MVRPKKSINTFRAYQQEKLGKRIAHINAFLASMGKNRARFQYVTDLAKLVAVHLSQVEGKNCVYSTLTRNLHYRALLEHYMARDVASGVKNALPTKTESPAMQALAVHTKLELANLKRENLRLKIYIEELMARGLKLEDSSIALPSATQGTENTDFVKTCQVLRRVIDDSDGILVINLDQLENEARIVHKVIADKKLLAPYMAWFRANSVE